MQNYFIHPKLGKIVIININNEEFIYKEINGKLTLLIEQERKEVTKIIKGNPRVLYHSIELDRIYNSNQKLNNYKKNKTLKSMLEYIENLIPENYKDNFYRNLSTLEIEYVPLEDEKESDIKTLGDYSIIENKIIIYKQTLEGKKKYAEMTLNPQETYNLEINKIFMHELLHLASSYYDEENQIMLCGFDDRYALNHNAGLTEGFTELLTLTAIQGTNEILSGYYIEALLTCQLTYIVGFDTMLKSYFGNLGTKKIEEELEQIDDNPAFSGGLLNQVIT